MKERKSRSMSFLCMGFLLMENKMKIIYQMVKVFINNFFANVQVQDHHTPHL